MEHLLTLQDCYSTKTPQEQKITSSQDSGTFPLNIDLSHFLKRVPFLLQISLTSPFSFITEGFHPFKYAEC